MAPGTAGSLAAALAGAILLAASPWVLAAALLAAALAGLWAIGVAAEDDPGWVVIDEVVGQWIALLALPRPALAGVAASFALFRLFDIAKPGPVGWAERLPGALGVLADDVVAGALAAATLTLANRLWPTQLT